MSLGAEWSSELASADLDAGLRSDDWRISQKAKFFFLDSYLDLQYIH